MIETTVKEDHNNRTAFSHICENGYLLLDTSLGNYSTKMWNYFTIRYENYSTYMNLYLSDNNSHDLLSTCSFLTPSVSQVLNKKQALMYLNKNAFVIEIERASR